MGYPRRVGPGFLTPRCRMRDPGPTHTSRVRRPPSLSSRTFHLYRRIRTVHLPSDLPGSHRPPDRPHRVRPTSSPNPRSSAKGHDAKVDETRHRDLEDE